MQPRKSYYAIIPADVRYDERLSPFARLLFGELTALSNEKGYSWASNDYFAKLYKVTKQAVSKWIKSLEDCNYIKIEYIREGKQIKTRKVSISVDRYQPQIKGVSTTDEGGCQPQIEENNTSTNNTINKNIDSVLTFFKEESGKSIKIETASHRKLVKTAFRKGYTVQDLKDVITLKNTEWKDSEKMKGCIVPRTLFRIGNLDNYMIEVYTRREKGHSMVSNTKGTNHTQTTNSRASKQLKMIS